MIDMIQFGSFLISCSWAITRSLSTLTHHPPPYCNYQASNPDTASIACALTVSYFPVKCKKKNSQISYITKCRSVPYIPSSPDFLSREIYISSWQWFFSAAQVPTRNLTPANENILWVTVPASKVSIAINGPWKVNWIVAAAYTSISLVASRDSDEKFSFRALRGIALSKLTGRTSCRNVEVI